MKYSQVEAREYAVDVIRRAVRPTGLYASGLPGGYAATWARDSMITTLGAALIDKEFEVPIRKSIELLAANQSDLGQIPNAVGTYNTDRRSDVTFNTIDSNLWYLIGHKVYASAYRKNALTKKYKNSIDAALLWLRYQDPNEDTLLVQQPTMDWQDAFPHKYGRVISTEAMYYGVLNMYGEKKRARHLRRVVNGEIEHYLSLYDTKLGYYLPWTWKNHDTEREQGTWFDSFGNLMAIITGLATPAIAKKILSHIKKGKIDRPYPVKAIYPPIKPGDKEWHTYFTTSDARTPDEYLNGGIWPFIGGLYIAALVSAGQFKKAEEEFQLLTHANKLTNDKRVSWGFQEWLHGRTGKPIGNSNAYQAWSAGTYLFAHECIKRKKVPFF